MKLCLSVIIMLLSFTVLAQNQKGYIYLKNGTILKGKYEYSGDMQKLMVRSAGNLWVFDATEVEKVTDKSMKKDSLLTEGIDTPFFMRTEIGFLVGNSENSQSAPLSLTGSVNYNVTSKFSVGGGMGIEFLKESYLPVFLNVEYKMRNTYSSPYFFLKTGYQVAIEESRRVNNYDYQPWSSFAPWPDYYRDNLDARGGILVNPGVGYQRMFSPTFGISISFGYQFHRLHFEGEENYELDLDYNRMTIKFGITFK